MDGECTADEVGGHVCVFHWIRTGKYSVSCVCNCGHPPDSNVLSLRASKSPINAPPLPNQVNVTLPDSATKTT